MFLSFLKTYGWFLLAPMTLPCIATVYIAHMYGRSGWRWLLISLVLPFVSVLLIMLLVSRESLRREREEDEQLRAERASRPRR